MIEFSGFTEKANAALNDSIKTASIMGHTYVGSEHILCGLLSDTSGVAGHILMTQGISKDSVVNKIERSIGTGIPTQLGIGDFTPRSRQILENALTEAHRENSSFVGTEHILYAMLIDEECYGSVFLREMGADIAGSMKDCTGSSSTKKASVPFPKRKNHAEGILSKYGRDLTVLASQNEIDPVIGREKEIQRMIQTLLRRRKNNPCLIGESGVGKTAIVEGLALNIVKGEIPEMLKDKRIFMLDIASMVAGAKYRGDFEERIKTALEEAANDKDTILFIDEIHSIVGAGSAEGAVDAANILKPLLARGEIQMIGATTIEEYRRYIEKDGALERRFQPIIVEEPDENTTKRILFGLRDKYEAHHKIKISDEAIHEAVKLSVRYINDRRLPDKALDLIDEAAARQRLKFYSETPVLKQLEEKLKLSRNEKIKAIEVQNFQEAEVLREKEEDLIQRIDNEKTDGKNSNFGIIDADAISEIVSQWSGIPVGRLSGDTVTSLAGLEGELKKEIIGQDKAVEDVVRAVKRGRTGLKASDRPIGSFIFLGPTGVGKTQLCKSLAKALFGSDKAMIRLDMSEFMEKHSVAKIIGSPPGYVGFENGSRFAEEVHRKPYSVILLDEIEKAHPDVFDLLLQILEDGILTASDGKRVSFSNSVIIMTGNIGAREITDKRINIGFGQDTAESRSKERVMSELKKIFKPEFINRVDEIVIFEPLSEKSAESICRLMLDDLCKRAKETGIDLSYTDKAVTGLVKKGYDKVYGVRSLRRTIVAEAEDRLAQALIDGTIVEGDSAVIDFDDCIRIFSKDLSGKRG